ncbi:MAG: hypothetical protein Q9195_002752 [Heterodermia aff. obscurata]
MKAFTTTLAIALAAIGIAAKAVPQEAIELPASLLTDRTIERLRPCWDAPDDSIHCTKAKREVERLRRPCWDAPDDSIHCTAAKREVERLRRPCWDAPDDSIHCTNAKREREFLGPCWRHPDESIRCPVVSKRGGDGYCFVDWEGVERCVDKNELRDLDPEVLAFGCYYADCGDCPLERHDCLTGAVVPVDTGSPPSVRSLENGNGNGNVLDMLAKRGDCLNLYGAVVCPKLKRVESDGKSRNTCSPPHSFGFSSSSSGHGAQQSPFLEGRMRLGKRQQQEGNYTATAHTLPGTFSPCGAWYLVTAADHITGCAGIEALFGIGLETLRALNRDINAGCTNLRGGFRCGEYIDPIEHFRDIEEQQLHRRDVDHIAHIEHFHDIDQQQPHRRGVDHIDHIKHFHDTEQQLHHRLGVDHIEHFHDTEQQLHHRRDEDFATAHRTADLLGSLNSIQLDAGVHGIIIKQQSHYNHNGYYLAPTHRNADLLRGLDNQLLEQHDTAIVS